MTPTHEQIAWAAGIFEGEGFVTGGASGRPSAVQVPQVDRWILDQLGELFGGTVRGPYGPYASSAGTRRRPIFRWVIAGDGARTFLGAIEPWLSPRRRAQVSLFVAAFDQRAKALTQPRDSRGRRFQLAGS